MPEQPLPTMATFFLANLSTEWLIGAMVSCLGATDGEGHGKGLGSWERLQLPKKYTGDDLHMSETSTSSSGRDKGGKAAGATHGTVHKCRGPDSMTGKR